MQVTRSQQQQPPPGLQVLFQPLELGTSCAWPR
ncbi:hypothetical protein CGRA01v4_01001 [Colletotrichum graminicola]|nr:hypothetical protein CGRA01v4_01001 [Colletotrichum graminicola]